MAIDYLLPTWDEYHTLTRKLAEKILTDNIHIDEIVAISRGGLTLGHLLTDLLRVPISTFTIQSYSDIQKSGEVKITKPLATPLDGKTVLDGEILEPGHLHPPCLRLESPACVQACSVATCAISCSNSSLSTSNSIFTDSPVRPMPLM